MKKFWRIAAPVIGALLIIILDQWTKFLTLINLSNLQGASFTETWTTPIDSIYSVNSVELIKGVLSLTFVKNQGMAWGLFQNCQIVFIILTILAVAFLIFHYIKAPWEKQYISIRVVEVLIIGGALGNLLDRIFRGGELFNGYVVDMVYVKAINFPVFNVADSAVSVAFVALIILLIFVYKDDDFNRLIDIFPKKEKASEKVNFETEKENVEIEEKAEAENEDN